MLARVLQAKDRGLTMVFCQTKRAADQVATALTTRGFAVATVHGDLGQGQRERALRAFRSGKVDVLTATEVAARGLDVDDVTHVVNYECPDDEKTYVHRIGRTGRAGRDGVAVTFVDWRDMHRWKLINKALGLGQPEPEETYSTSEHLYAELDIPREATGTLPRSMRDRAGLEAEAVEDIGETGKIRLADEPGADEDRSTRQKAGPTGNAAGPAGEGGRPARDGGGRADQGGPDSTAAGAARPRRRTRRKASRLGQLAVPQLSWVGSAPVSTPTSLSCPTGSGPHDPHHSRLVRGPGRRSGVRGLRARDGSARSRLHRQQGRLPLRSRAARDRGRRVVAIDMRGQYENPGRRRTTASPRGALGGGHRAVDRGVFGARHLLGHSYGGLVVREALLEATASVGSLTLMSSGPSALTGPRAAELSGVLAVLGVADGAVPDPAELQAQIGGLWRDYLEPQAVAAGVQGPIVAFLAKRMLSNDPNGLVLMARHILTAPDRTAELARLVRQAPIPVLVLYGENDNSWSPDTQEDMARRLGARRVCIPGAEHSPAVEAPATTAGRADPVLERGRGLRGAQPVPGTTGDRGGGAFGTAPEVVAPPAGRAGTRREHLVVPRGRQAPSHQLVGLGRTPPRYPPRGPGAWPVTHRCVTRPAPVLTAGGAARPGGRAAAAPARRPARRAPGPGSCARRPW